MKKYIVIPGYVKSMNDGDVHYINSRKLMDLYQVKSDQCWVMNEEDYERRKDMDHLKTLTVLRPNYNGNYKIEDVE